MIKDYDLEILYHPGKANVVADALSRKKQMNVAALITTQKWLVEDLRRMDIEVVLGDVEVCLASLRLQPDLQSKIKTVQLSSQERDQILSTMRRSDKTAIRIDDVGVIRHGDRLWVPAEEGLRKEIMKEAHPSTYSVHPGSTKMYKDLKQHFWWNNMKRDVAEYVSKCLTCQQVRIEHQRPGGELQPLPIPEWKWESVTMDFVSALPRTPSGYEVVWVIVD